MSLLLSQQEAQIRAHDEGLTKLRAEVKDMMRAEMHHVRDMLGSMLLPMHPPQVRALKYSQN